MHEQDKKVKLTRTDIVQQHTHDQLVECLRNFIGLCALAIFSVLFTGYLFSNWSEMLWIVRIMQAVICAFSWLITVLLGYITVQNAIRLLYLRQGKYTLEIDRITLLECKTEEEYQPSPSGRGHGRTEIVTNQYVYFEKYGKVKSNRPLKNGQECYLLVVQTKKPHVRKFWECDDHEIKGI